jgi:tRNA(fMet)-specific endonuclease VapC
MPAVVVDTDVFSFLFKGDNRGDVYLPHLAGRLLVISFMTLAELDRWALAHRWGPARKARRELYLRRYVVQHSERALCLKWAEVKHVTNRRGAPIDTADAWVAATALLHGAPLVTHNAGDFAGVEGLTIVSERTT